MYFQLINTFFTPVYVQNLEVIHLKHLTSEINEQYLYKGVEKYQCIDLKIKILAYNPEGYIHTIS